MKRLFPLFTALCSPLLLAADPVESDYYKITTFETPKETALEVGSIELLPDGKLALGTRRGEIWTVSGAGSSDPSNGELQALCQRPARGARPRLQPEGQVPLRDQPLRDRAAQGHGWRRTRGRLRQSERQLGRERRLPRVRVRLALRQSTATSGSCSASPARSTARCPFAAGRCASSPTARWCPTCSGIRCPGGIGFDADGEVYYTDNQGPWHGSCTLQHLVPGTFQGHPGGNVWYDMAPNMGPRPIDPDPRGLPRRSRPQRRPPRR